MLLFSWSARELIGIQAIWLAGLFAVDCLESRFVFWLVEVLVCLLVCLSVSWLVGFLVGCLLRWSFNRLVHCFWPLLRVLRLLRWLIGCLLCWLIGYLLRWLIG